MESSHGFDAFHARGKSLEESYFRTKDAQLVEKLRKVFQSTLDKEELRKATGITNDEVLDRLIRLNVRGELLTAFKLYPLVEIAWADGRLDKKEADAVVHAAITLGLPKDSDSLARLKEWVQRGPTPDGRAAWRMFASELRKVLSPHELNTFRDDLLKHAKAVADTSGGILDMFLNTSAAEKRVIDKIRELLTHE
jgi:uncharacterized tellurite resistance protein B-like protein